jgi:hypothetical protein
MRLLSVDMVSPLFCEQCDDAVDEVVLFEGSELEIELCEICISEALKLFRREPSEESSVENAD